MRFTLLLLCICATLAQSILLPDNPNRLPSGFMKRTEQPRELGESNDNGQKVWNPCPELSVNCVLDGDWRNPVGTLGKKRTSCTCHPPPLTWFPGNTEPCESAVDCLDPAFIALFRHLYLPIPTFRMMTRPDLSLLPRRDPMQPV